MKKFFLASAALLCGVLLVNCCGKMKQSKVVYPETRKDTTVIDNYFGTKVADPYRWLEDDNSAETAAWVTAENEVTHHYLSQIPFHDQVKTRLEQLWNYPKDGIPSKAGDYYFFLHNDGLQNQSVLYYQKGLDGKPEVFLDPNTLSNDGTVALGALSFSEDGKYMAYSTSASGSDWTEIRVMDIATHSLLSDVIKWTKFSTVDWDSNGFYYSRYDEPDQKSMMSAQNKFQKVYYHKLGNDQSKDNLIYEDKEHPLRYFHPSISEDGRWLFIGVTEGTHGGELLWKDLSKPGSQFKVLFKGFEYDYTVVRADGGKAWIFTNDHAPNYRLAQVDLTADQPELKDVIAEDPNTLLQGVSSAGNTLIAEYLDKATSKVVLCDLDGKAVKELKFPTLGTAAGFAGRIKDTETFFSLSNFITPSTIYRLDLASGEFKSFREPKLTYDPSLYMAEQVFYPSKDGTQVSMFIVHRKDMKLDGKNPLYLYGYGGFNNSLTPAFNPSAIMLLEQGGIYVMVNLRGGGEYGEKWHHAGMMEKKQNVFDDFIAAAQYLIDKKYTSHDKLGIAGGSNGGLLVGACMTQRPELFAVALPAVGVMDMLRYHKFTVGWGWAVEYGSSEDKDQFEYLYKYSPLHNIKPGTCYPATLITTGDHDDRVVPAHSFKFAATLQAAQSCDNPCLIRIDTKAGHGAGKPISKRIEEAADTYSFFLFNTGAKVNFPAGTPAAQHAEGQAATTAK